MHRDCRYAVGNCSHALFIINNNIEYRMFVQAFQSHKQLLADQAKNAFHLDAIPLFHA